MIHRILLAGLAAALLAGCPAFYVDRGPLVQPTRTLVRPPGLPAADAYVALDTQWRREARIGVAGAVEGLLRDPELVAAEVAHSAAVQSLDHDAARDLLRTEWLSAFGQQLDRWTIDLTWRFDEQFVQHQTVLDPSTWTFSVRVDETYDYPPLAVLGLSHTQVPQQHFWEGKVRLWFPWRDPLHDRLVLAGITRAIRLRLRHPTGSADLYWRFRTAY
ncbi:MAG: hypothetical protein JWM80_5204 [Cyanobacteria bacterium RYN_339]|nr:hypothetical protein [Cyanobacteria bacterium RYN_339]